MILEHRSDFNHSEVEVGDKNMGDNRPDTRLAEALAHCRGRLLAVEPAVMEDAGPEPVHEFRVAIRRARSLLKVMPKVLHVEPSAQLEEDFAWIAQTAGMQRDLDMLLADFERRRGRLNLDEGVCAKLMGRLRARRDVAHRHLLRALSSARYRRLKTNWFKLINALRTVTVGAQEVGRRMSGVVRREFISLCRRARRLRRKDSRHRLHELRKQCKQLRYTVESFDYLWPSGPVRRTIDALCELQDELGKYCDLQAERTLLADFVSSKMPGVIAEGMKVWLRDVRRRIRRRRDKSIDYLHHVGKKLRHQVGAAAFQFSAAS